MRNILLAIIISLTLAAGFAFITIQSDTEPPSSADAPGLETPSKTHNGNVSIRQAFLAVAILFGLDYLLNQDLPEEETPPPPTIGKPEPTPTKQGQGSPSTRIERGLQVLKELRQKNKAKQQAREAEKQRARQKRNQKENGSSPAQRVNDRLHITDSCSRNPGLCN